MLLKSGGLKKGEIGAIRIRERQTFVELAPRGVERFLKTIGPDMKVEAAITASRIDGTPDLSQSRSEDSPSKARNFKGEKKRSAPLDENRTARKDTPSPVAPRPSGLRSG